MPLNNIALVKTLYSESLQRSDPQNLATLFDFQLTIAGYFISICLPHTG